MPRAVVELEVMYEMVTSCPFFRLGITTGDVGPANHMRLPLSKRIFPSPLSTALQEKISPAATFSSLPLAISGASVSAAV